jgi:hypothetical protein
MPAAIVLTTVTDTTIDLANKDADAINARLRTLVPDVFVSSPLPDEPIVTITKSLGYQDPGAVRAGRQWATDLDLYLVARACPSTPHAGRGAPASTPICGGQQ